MTDAMASHGLYQLQFTLLSNDLIIIRRDEDGRRRTVATIQRFQHWVRFVDALKGGADEVAAVHAIDAKVSS